MQGTPTYRKLLYIRFSMDAMETECELTVCSYNANRKRLFAFRNASYSIQPSVFLSFQLSM